MSRRAEEKTAEVLQESPGTTTGGARSQSREVTPPPPSAHRPQLSLRRLLPQHQHLWGAASVPTSTAYLGWADFSQLN